MFAHQHLHQGINSGWIYLKPFDQKSYIPATENKYGHGYSITINTVTAKRDIYLVQDLRSSIKLCILEMTLRYNTLDDIGPYFVRN